MARLRVMSWRGDSSYEWDPKRVAVGDPESEAAVREAERIFREERARGATAFRVMPGALGEKIDVFDPNAEQIVMIPRVAGG
ncbi:MAG TPA: hypothetical protein VGP33_06690 [Chloroflexota bacterium]|nr:hypothetical protein [Chloroflexota bacterium]